MESLLRVGMDHRSEDVFPPNRLFEEGVDGSSALHCTCSWMRAWLRLEIPKASSMYFMLVPLLSLFEDDRPQLAFLDP
jgi:hypothetical protein